MTQALHRMLHSLRSTPPLDPRAKDNHMFASLTAHDSSQIQLHIGLHRPLTSTNLARRPEGNRHDLIDDIGETS